MNCRARVAGVCLLVLLTGCSEEHPERKSAEKVRSKAEVQRRCSAIDQALALVRERGRTDLVGTDAQCSTVDLYDCSFKVELMVELSTANAAVINEQIATIGEPCASEYRFAVKYGIEAFRDHRKLLEEAMDDTERRDDWPTTKRVSVNLWVGKVDGWSSTTSTTFAGVHASITPPIQTTSEGHTSIGGGNRVRSARRYHVAHFHRQFRAMRR